jgi:hypothetical protein
MKSVLETAIESSESTVAKYLRDVHSLMVSDAMDVPMQHQSDAFKHFLSSFPYYMLLHFFCFQFLFTGSGVGRRQRGNQPVHAPWRPLQYKGKNALCHKHLSPLR